MPDDACSYNDVLNPRTRPGAAPVYRTGRLASFHAEDPPTGDDAATGKNSPPASPSEPTLEEYNARVRANLAIFAQVRDYVAQKDRGRKAALSPGKVHLAAAGRDWHDSSRNRLVRSGGGAGFDLGSMKNFNDGLRAATDPTDFKGKRDWIDKNTASTINIFNSASAALGGQSSNGDQNFNPSRHSSAPANTSQQRLGLSAAMR